MRHKGISDLPQPIWGYIFIALAALLLLGLFLTDPRKEVWLRRFHRMRRGGRE